MSKASITDDLVPPEVRRRWERQYVDLKAKLSKLEMLLSASGGLPPEDGAEHLNGPPGQKKKETLASAAKRRLVRPRRAAGVRQSAEPVTSAVGLASDTSTPARETGRTRHKEGTWTACVRNVVLASEQAMTYSQVKDALKDSDVAPLLARSDKAFYGALGKLEADGVVIRYKGHVFSPAVYQRFKADLDAGRVRDLKFPNPAHHSPMGEAIVEILKGRTTGADSGNIKWQLAKTKFADDLKRNPTHIYNVLSRLVNQGILSKNRDGQYRYVPVKDEAPSGNSPEGASNSSDEGGASSGNGQQTGRGLFG